ncbi:hypothetical protein N9363_01515 [Paracoccaceae bacterium]|nr:hypothetical protein [Paracoccaceae bacterium]
MFRKFFIAMLLPILSACYQFETDPLKDSGSTFKDTVTYRKLARLGAKIPEAQPVNGQPSPFGDIGLSSSVIEVSDSTILYSYPEKGEWKIGMISFSEDHIYLCSLLMEDGETVEVPSGLYMQINEEPMNKFAKITGDQELIFEFAKQLGRQSTKFCMAVPHSKLIVK